MAGNVDSPKRKRRIQPVREILESEEIEPKFEVIDGLRYVVPYNFIFRTYTKQRWFGQKILEVRYFSLLIIIKTVPLYNLRKIYRNFEFEPKNRPT